MWKLNPDFKGVQKQENGAFVGEDALPFSLFPRSVIRNKIYIKLY